MELGVIEGQQGNSMLSPDAYAVMDGKTSRFGGLYIFRDKFRVLPYGRVDFDFLKFEERRAKRMGEYFFRYNKMFGYLGITRDANRNLTDKAGREGLIENKAYREFKRDLIELFIDLAKTYFATPDKNSDNARSEQQEEIRKRNEKMADAEKRNVQQARKAFMDELAGKGGQSDTARELAEKAEGYLAAFHEAMDDDFNTALAISHMFALAKEINVYKAQTDSGDVAPDGKLVDMMTKVFAEFCSIIGVLEGEAEAAGNDGDGGLTEQLMQLLLELRQDARKAKNYAQADAIRNKLGEMGIVIEDTPQGARWKKQ
jgi:hypothetical protein